MNASDNHNITELNNYLREEIPKINNNLSKIERAIYGDPDNGVQGLIDYNKQTQLEMHKIDRRFENKIEDFQKLVDENVTEIKERVSGLEKLSNKLKWIASGLIAGASIGGASIWNEINQYFTTLK